MVVRVRVRVASIAQNPCGSVSTPATSRAAVRARAMRTAFWKNTERRPACPRSRYHHRTGAQVVAYQNRPGSSSTEVCRPRTARSAAAPMASAASAISSTAAWQRRTAGGRQASAGVTGGPADTADSSARATVSSFCCAAGDVPVRRQLVVAVAVRATAPSTAVTSGAVPRSGSAGSSASLPSRVRVARPVWASARSRTPGPAGRSASGTLSGRSDWLVSRAARMSVPDRAPRCAASFAAHRSATAAARAARSRYDGGAGSRKSSASAATNRASPVVVPISRSPSEPGSYGGKEGRM